jgi:thioredoxin reductase
LFSNGPTELSDAEQHALRMNGVEIVPEELQAFEDAGDGADGVRVIVDGRRPIECGAVFVSGSQHQRSPLVAKLGCHLNEKGIVVTGQHESTNVPGLFVAGDASDNVQFAIIAAAEGTEAAFEIHRSLLREEFASRLKDGGVGADRCVPAPRTGDQRNLHLDVR